MKVLQKNSKEPTEQRELKFKGGLQIEIQTNIQHKTQKQKLSNQNPIKIIGAPDK